MSASGLDSGLEEAAAAPLVGVQRPDEACDEEGVVEREDEAEVDVESDLM